MIRKSVVSGQWSVVSESGQSRAARLRRPSGITLTEILIAIMILGIGLVSLATLFPIGLVRLRDATRYTRSATLLQTAASDAAARGMFAYSTFTYADNLNGLLSSNAPPYWYTRRMRAGSTRSPRTRPSTAAIGRHSVRMGVSFIWGPM